jgi:hypothetical protein
MSYLIFLIQSLNKFLSVSQRRIIAVITVIALLCSGSLAPLAHALQLPAPALPLLLPVTLGKVTAETIYPGHPLLVVIQDLHCHAEVQRNINAILAMLERQYGLRQILVEGASGPVDTSWLDRMKNEPLKKEIADTLLDEGRLTGSEYYSIINKKYNLLQGLEYERLHRENIKRLGRLLARKPAYAVQLRALSEDLKFLKAKYFSAKNKRFNRLVDEYAEGSISSIKFYSLLAKYAQEINRSGSSHSPLFTLRGYPNISACLALQDRQKQFRENRIRFQLQALLRYLKSALPYKEYYSLMSEMQNFAKIDMAYRRLPEIVRQHRIELSRYPDLAAFFAYMEQVHAINPLEQIREERRLAEAIRLGLAENTEELEVSFLNDFFCCYKDYLLTKLSADDYAVFKQKFDKFKMLWARYVHENRLPALDADYPLLDTYYRTNVERNDYFVKNILSAVSSTDNKTGVFVVVAGGFHTEALQSILTKQHLSCITITPTVNEDTQKAAAIYTELVREQAANALQLTIQSELEKSLTKKLLADALWRKAGINKPKAVLAALYDMGIPARINKKKQLEIEIEGKIITVGKNAQYGDTSFKAQVLLLFKLMQSKYARIEQNEKTIAKSLREDYSLFAGTISR